MGFLCDNISMSTDGVDLEVQMVEGEWRPGYSKSHLWTRLEFTETHFSSVTGHPTYLKCTEWYLNPVEARGRIQAVMPDMLRRFRELCVQADVPGYK